MALSLQAHEAGSCRAAPLSTQHEQQQHARSCIASITAATSCTCNCCAQARGRVDFGSRHLRGDSAARRPVRHQRRTVRLYVHAQQLGDAQPGTRLDNPKPGKPAAKTHGRGHSLPWSCRCCCQQISRLSAGVTQVRSSQLIPGTPPRAGLRIYIYPSSGPAPPGSRRRRCMTRLGASLLTGVSQGVPPPNGARQAWKLRRPHRMNQRHARRGAQSHCRARLQRGAVCAVVSGAQTDGALGTRSGRARVSCGRLDVGQATAVPTAAQDATTLGAGEAEACVCRGGQGHPSQFGSG